ncbi:MAG: hypothetical protein A2020_06480 [Lentisphaerae bacterium GWF2_45_14]|nr:MAG: hypothetical protein A2020_06480 [Lentisphaerae bacterium GWF2_45_14]
MKNAEFKFMTPVNAPEKLLSLDMDSVVTGSGSCFAEDMLERLFSLGIKGLTNPCGTLYNAVSMYNHFERAAEKRLYSAADFFEYNGLWNGWEHHGSFSKASLEEAVELSNRKLVEFRTLLEKSSMCIVTPSSSVVYEHLPEKRIAANCHKLPGKEFSRRLLEYEENLNALKGIVEAIRRLNKDCSIVFTVSPVRHYPGELTLNTLSKSLLFAALKSCMEKFPDMVYFPSYEIVMDELRDYRFYNEDMLHPNELARKIIFARFTKTFFSSEAIEIMEKSEKALKFSNHIRMRQPFG